METITRYKANLAAIKIADNMVGYWELPDELAPYIGQIHSIYMMDRDRSVYCCEITPSRELWFHSYTFDPPEGVEYDSIPEEIKDQIDMMLHKNYPDTEVFYYHQHVIDNLIAKNESKSKGYADTFFSYGEVEYNTEEHEGETEDDLYIGAISEIREYLNCNGVF